jgi:translocation and assembly module TamB
LSLALLSACAALALLWLATTQTGTRWTLSLVRGLTPGELSWDEVQGTLGGPLTIRGLRYANDSFTAETNLVHLVPHLSKLLGGTLDIETATVKDLRIRVKPGGPTPSSPPHQLVPFLKVKLRDLTVQGLVLTRPEGAAPITLRQLTAAFTADGHTLDIGKLTLSRDDGELSANGRIDVSGDYTVQVDTHWEARLPDRPVLRGHGRITGGLRQLIVELSLTAPSAVEANAKIDDPLGNRHWRASLRFNDFDASQFDPASPALVMRGHAEAADDGTGMRLHANVDASLPRYGSWTITAAIRRQTAQSWQIESLALAQGRRSASASGGVDWDGSGPPRIDLKGQWQELGWPLEGQAAVRSDAGSFTLRGTPSDYRLQANGGLAGGSLPKTQWQLAGRGDNHGFAAKQLSAQTLGGQIEAVADVSWSPSMTFHAHGDWRKLAYQFAAGRRMESPQGSFSLDADAPDHYRFNVEADTQAEKLPPIAWSLSGHGSGTEVILDKTVARTLKGTLQGKGSVRFAPDTSWTFTLAGSNFDPSAQWPEWRGQLALNAQTEGHVTDGRVQANLTLNRLDGTLRGYPFSASANLDLAGRDFQLKTLEVHSGHSRLAASGLMANKRVSGTWSLSSRDLAELLPDAAGRLESSGRIGGSTEALSVDATLNGKGLQAAGLRADRLDGTLSISDVDTRAFKLDLRANGLRYKQRELASLNVTGSGTDKAHRIEVHATGTEGQVELAIRGGLTADRQWSGQIEQGSVKGPAIGEWRLTQAFALEAASDHVRAGRQCWQGGPGSKDASRLCVDGKWAKGGDWAASLDATAFDLARFDPWLPSPISGLADARLRVSGAGSAVSSIQGTVHAAAGHVHMPKRYASTPEAFAYRSADLSIQGTSGAAGTGPATPLTVTLSVVPQTAGMSPLHADLHLPTVAVTADTPISGGMSVAMTDLGWVDTVTPELDEVKGRIEANLKIAGRVGQPRLQGKITMNGSATVPRYGLQLSKIEITGSGNDSGLDLSGNIDSGEGTLHLSGRAELDAAKGWPVTLHVEGKRFKTADIPEVWMLVSPKLDLSSSGRDITLRGEVTIPEAKLEPKLDSGAVPLSNDVVVVSGKTDKASVPKHEGWRIDSRIKIIFGDKVTLKTPILNGRLTGSLQVRDIPDSTTTATGELQIVDGDIGAYGQKLKIDRGRIVFAGGPLVDPALDLRASRSVGSVTAGVLIQGRLNQPSTSLYSQPSMSDADTLSYLLLGQPMQQASAADGQTLLQAAASLGLEHSDLVTARIAHTLGLEHVSVQKDSSSGNLAVSIGKYLAPKLYVSYGLGLLQSSNVVKLRYELSRHWSIEAESGTGTGADILYNLER